VGIGLGVATITAGAIVGSIALAKNDASNNKHCLPNNHCDAEGTELRNSARRFGNASTISLVTGAILGAAGVTLVVISAPPKTTEASAPKAQLSVTPGGLSFHGAW